MMFLNNLLQIAIL